MGKIIDTSTGEILNNKFFKMYISDIGSLFSLSKKQINLLMVMMRDCKYGNEINMNPARKKRYVDEIEVCSQNSLNNLLKKLELCNLVKKDLEYPTKYTINPQVCFKGNDYQYAKVLISYEGGDRKIEVLDSE